MLLGPRTKISRTAAQHLHSTASRTSLYASFTPSTLLFSKKQGPVLIGDGQVSMGNTVVKDNAQKVRVLQEGKIVAGFAGSTADAFTLFDRLSDKIEEFQGQLLRSCVALAKDWRTDKYLRKLDALMIVSDNENAFTITGAGDVLEPTDGVVAIGSGGDYALAAARALIGVEGMTAEEIAKKSMDIAADICVYTNKNYTIQKLTKTHKEELKK